ncbi:hypothetical protein [Pedobacter sp. SYSU D00535]|uniref:hypothetical protein n=1 Tax=Pedobacter sp. SYSU D00535 TaxID=2810308 RepID=UPI001A96D36F|nr:hypothetical protein [Pedobacter sp. SYSU D00535]
MKDKDKVSNQYHELKALATKFNVSVWQVMKAKEDLQTNDRKPIEEYLSAIRKPEE